jgi:threonine dehydratase/serine racemase
MTEYAVSLESVRAAHQRILPHIHSTPILTSHLLDGLAGRELFFKCENFQRGGAFKMRGAANAVLALSDRAAERGVATHSSGNFAQALALAARTRGVPAHVVMPTSAPAVKRAATIGYGARVYDCEPTLAAREERAAEVVAATGATLLHPFNHRDVIAGQGTTALELLEEVPDLDAVVAPVGGGGLMSGICVASRGMDPRIRLIGAEPLGADDAWRSLAAGRLIPQTGPDTIADGLLTSLGDLTWPILRDHLLRIVRVTDDEIRAALLLVMTRMKIVIEPSAATAFAAVLTEEFQALPGLRRVGIVLSGGNTAP